MRLLIVIFALTCVLVGVHTFEPACALAGFGLAVFYRTAEEKGAGLYSSMYKGLIDYQLLLDAEKLQNTDLAVGLTYYAYERVGTGPNGEAQYVPRKHTIREDNYLDDIKRAQSFMAHGVAVKEELESPYGDPAQQQSAFYTDDDFKNDPKLQKRREKGEIGVGTHYTVSLKKEAKAQKASADGAGAADSPTVDGTSITQRKTTNEFGIQNDDSDADQSGSLVADNTTNEIQAEQIAHTIYQTTEPPTRLAGAEPADRFDGDKAPTEDKTTNESGVQNDDPKGGSLKENVSQGGTPGNDDATSFESDAAGNKVPQTGGEWREDYAQGHGPTHEAAAAAGEQE